MNISMPVSYTHLTAFSIGKSSSGVSGIGKPAIIPASSKKDSLTWDSREAAGIRTSHKKPADTEKGNAGPVFGDMPGTEKLRPAGHGKIDLAVRWVTKKADGLYCLLYTSCIFRSHNNCL